MKITAEHLEAVAKCVKIAHDRIPFAERMDKRGRIGSLSIKWMMLYEGVQELVDAGEPDLIIDVLYKYLNDDHINTALGRVFSAPEYKLPEVNNAQ